MKFQEAALNALDSSRLLERYLAQKGREVYQWQRRVLRSNSKRILMACARQSGKSTVAACLALHTAMYHSGSLILIFSKSQRQSEILFDKVAEIRRGMEEVPIESVNLQQMRLVNNSRVIALPGDNPDAVRGYSAVDLIVIDEASFVDDRLYVAIRPMLIASGGRLVCLGTFHGRRGFFWTAWSEGDEWERVMVTADEVPHLSPEELEKDRIAMGEAAFQEEYYCVPVDNAMDVFPLSSIEKMMIDEPPLEI